jgi:hypothetical protein
MQTPPPPAAPVPLFAPDMATDDPLPPPYTATPLALASRTSATTSTHPAATASSPSATTTPFRTPSRTHARTYTRTPASTRAEAPARTVPLVRMTPTPRSTSKAARLKARASLKINTAVPLSRPEVSSPLTREPFSAQLDTGSPEGDEDFGPMNPFLLPSSAAARKAYPNGVDLSNSIPRNSGVLTLSEPDIFSSDGPELACVQVDQQRVGVRIGPDCDAHVSGEMVAISGNGETASAAGPSARAVAVMPARGLAAAAYLNGGKAHISIVRAPPSSDVTSGPTTALAAIPAASPHAAILAATSPLVAIPVAPAPPSLGIADAAPSRPLQSKRRRSSISLKQQEAGPATQEDGVVNSPDVSVTAPSAQRVMRPSRAASAMQNRPRGANSQVSTVSSATRRASRRVASSAGSVTSAMADLAITPATRPVKRPKTTAASPPGRARRGGDGPVTAQALLAAGITTESLQGTALGPASATIIAAAPKMTMSYVRLVAHLIAIDSDTAIPTASGKGTGVYLSTKGTRPKQVGLLVKTARIFTRGVFAEYDEKVYAQDFNKWWAAITEDICRPPSSSASLPGALQRGADLTPLKYRGQNGFGSIVAALTLWILALMRDDTDANQLTFGVTPTAAQMKKWNAAVSSVEAVAAAIVAGRT